MCSQSLIKKKNPKNGFFFLFFEKNRKETLKPQKLQLFPALWVPLFSGESQPGILLALTWATRPQCLHPRVSPRALCPLRAAGQGRRAAPHSSHCCLWAPSSRLGAGSALRAPKAHTTSHPAPQTQRGVPAPREQGGKLYKNLALIIFVGVVFSFFFFFQTSSHQSRARCCPHLLQASSLPSLPAPHTSLLPAPAALSLLNPRPSLHHADPRPFPRAP